MVSQNTEWNAGDRLFFDRFLCMLYLYNYACDKKNKKKWILNLIIHMCYVTCHAKLDRTCFHWVGIIHEVWCLCFVRNRKSEKLVLLHSVWRLQQRIIYLFSHGIVCLVLGTLTLGPKHYPTAGAAGSSRWSYWQRPPDTGSGNHNFPRFPAT